MPATTWKCPAPAISKKTTSRALQSGRITQAAIDDNARRILRTVMRAGLLNGSRTPNPQIVNSPEHQRLTFEAASQGIVLLKNEGSILPLDRARVKSIAVIGAAATQMQVGASGSPSVQPFYSINPLEGITKSAGANAVVRYVRGTVLGQAVPTLALVPPTGQGSGLQAEYFANRNLEGTPALVRRDAQVQFAWNDAPAPGIDATNFSVRWTGKITAPATGRYPISFSADDGCRVFLDGK